MSPSIETDNSKEEGINALTEAERLYEDDKLLEAARLLSMVDHKDLKEKHKEILRRGKGLYFLLEQEDITFLFCYSIMFTDSLTPVTFLSWRGFTDRSQN